MTYNLTKALQRENISAIEGRETVMKTVETFKSMRNIDSYNWLLFRNRQEKAEHHNFIDEPVFPRKRKTPNYKSLNDFFIVEGQSSRAPLHYPPTSKEHLFFYKYQVNSAQPQICLNLNNIPYCYKTIDLLFFSQHPSLDMLIAFMLIKNKVYRSLQYSLKF